MLKNNTNTEKLSRLCLLKQLAEHRKYLQIEHKYADETDIAVSSVALKIVNGLKQSEKLSFNAHVRKYFITCSEYIVHKFPLKEEFLDLIKVADMFNAHDKNILISCTF